MGEDTTPVEGDSGNMKMGDLPIAPNQPFNPIDPNKITSTMGNSKGCNACHSEGVPAPVKKGDPILSVAIHPFSKSCNSQGVDVSQYVIDTDDPSETVKVGEVEVGKVPVMAQKLADVCKCIKDNQAAIKADANTKSKVEDNFPTLAMPDKAQNPNLDPATLLALCNNLSDYHDKRACGKTTDSDGTPLACAEVDGGGKFLDNPPVDNGVSTVVFALDGEATLSSSSGSTTYTWVNTGGSISAFDFKTRKQIASVQVATLSATAYGSGDLQILGSGMAVVNGSKLAVLFNFTRTGTLTTYYIKDAVTLTNLAAGTGETGRAGIALLVGP